MSVDNGTTTKTSAKLTFDWTFNPAIMLAIVLNFSAVVWFASALNSRLTVTENFIAESKVYRERFIRNEAQTEEIGKSLNRIETKVDKLTERGR